MRVDPNVSHFRKGASTLVAVALMLSPMITSGRERTDSEQLKISPFLLGSQNPAPPMMAMPLVAPVFFEDQEFSSTLVLVNASSENTYATVTVRSLSGSIITRQRVPLPPSNQVRVPVSGLLLQTWSTETRGSILVEQSPDLMGMVVLAQLSITHRGSRLSYIDEELSMPDAKMGSRILRAVGHGKEASTLIGISSLAQNRQAIRIDCLSRQTSPVSKTIELAPNSTVLTEVCSAADPRSESLTSDQEDRSSDESDATGIQLMSDGGPGQFAAFGISRRRSDANQIIGAVSFSDPRLAASSSSVFVGLPVGAADLLGPGVYKLRVKVANFTHRPSQIKISFSKTSGELGLASGSNVVVRAITLQPQRAESLSLSGFQGDPGLRNSFVVTSDAGPGDIGVAMASKAPGAEGEVGLLAKDAQQPENAGFHPWSTDDENDSTLLTFNHTDGPQRIVVTILSGQALWQKVIILSPFETNALNINALIKNKVPDDRQRILPLELAEGEVSWTMEHPKTLTGRLLVSNRVSSVARNFSCGAYPVLCGASMSPTIGNVPVGGTGTSFYVSPSVCIAYNQFDCSGSQSGGGISPYYSWTAGSTFSVSNCNGSGSCSPVGTIPGASQISVQSSYNSCSYTSHGTVNVAPKITGSNTVWYFNNLTVSGYTTSLQLSSNGGSSTTWNITAGANKITLSSFTGSSINVLSSGTAFSSSVGDVKVTATTNGQTSIPFSLTTRAPNRLVPGAVQLSCDSTYGYLTTANYTIQDQLLSALPSAVPLNENFTTGWGVDYTGTPGTNWNSTLPRAVPTTTQAPNFSQMADHMSGQNKVNPPTPIPLPTCDGNSTPVVHIGQEWRIGSLATGFGRRVQTDTVERYVGHAAHLSILSPAP